MKNEIHCDVYRSSRKENLYIYVTKEEGLDRVPAELLAQFGEPEIALSFMLTSDRQLAKEDPERVLINLNNQGYHLQLPPAALGGQGPANAVPASEGSCSTAPVVRRPLKE